MVILPECVFVSHIGAWCPWRPEEGVRCPWTGVTNGCNPLCGLWDWNWDPPYFVKG